MVIKGLGERFIDNIMVKDKNQINVGSMNYDQIYPIKKRFEGLRAESIPAPVLTEQKTTTSTTTVSNIVQANSYRDGLGNSMFIFKIINCPAGTDPVAETLTDTLNLTSSTSAITITGNNATDTVDFKLKSQGTYTPSNVTTDRSFDADTVLVAELADVVGTLIADLKLSGIIS